VTVSGAPRTVVVLLGPGVVADAALLAEVTTDTCAALGVTGRLVRADTPAEVSQRLGEVAADPTAVAVVLPGPVPAVRALAERAGAADRTVWYDLSVVEPLPVAPGGVHLAGRGVFGLVWAIRHGYWRVAAPARRVWYGTHPEQWADLRLPATAPPRGGAVLLHGGFWRSVWGADLMDALAVDLTRRGFVTWNLEYRRPDRFGWEVTAADVAAGLAHLATVPEVDPDRVAVLGHSAGGQLALRAAADGVRVRVVVSLAGVLDLAEGDRREIGTGAVTAALAGGVADRPERYAAADPLARVPIGVRQLIVQGQQDDLDLIDFNRRYVAAARAAGDEVTYLEAPGDHFAVIDPAAPIWQQTVARMETLLTGAGEQLRSG